MFGAEKFASTNNTFLSKFFASEQAVSRARVVSNLGAVIHRRGDSSP